MGLSIMIFVIGYLVALGFNLGGRLEYDEPMWWILLDVVASLMWFIQIPIVLGILLYKKLN